jgi:hypothetical protein
VARRSLSSSAREEPWVIVARSESPHLQGWSLPPCAGNRGRGRRQGLDRDPAFGTVRLVTSRVWVLTLAMLHANCRPVALLSGAEKSVTASVEPVRPRRLAIEMSSVNGGVLSLGSRLREIAPCEPSWSRSPNGVR